MGETGHASTTLPRDSEEQKPQCTVGTGMAPPRRGAQGESLWRHRLEGQR